MQMVSGVGHLLIVTQKMLFDTMIFMFMLFLLFMGFALGLYLLHINPKHDGCDLIARNTTEAISDKADGAYEMFQTFPDTLYETFLLMFTVMAPFDIYFEVCSNQLHLY